MPTQLARTLEPEYMDDPSEASLYDAMNHDEVNERFVVDLLSSGSVGERVIDLGTGTARIPIILCRKVPGVRVMAIDAAIHMLEVAIRNIDVAGLRDCIQLEKSDAKNLSHIESEVCDCLISNSLLHHLADPVLALREAVRLTKSGGRLFIRDLMRPQSSSDVEHLTRLYAGHEPAESQQLLRQSLHAALSLQEAQQLASDCGLNPLSVYASSDRHWTLDANK